MKAEGMFSGCYSFHYETCWTFHGCFTASVMKGFLDIAIGNLFFVRC